VRSDPVQVPAGANALSSAPSNGSVPGSADTWSAASPIGTSLVIFESRQRQRFRFQRKINLDSPAGQGLYGIRIRNPVSNNRRLILGRPEPMSTAKEVEQHFGQHRKRDRPPSEEAGRVGCAV
jgi:hypothetical protein